MSQNYIKELLARSVPVEVPQPRPILYIFKCLQFCTIKLQNNSFESLWALQCFWLSKVSNIGTTYKSVFRVLKYNNIFIVNLRNTVLINNILINNTDYCYHIYFPQKD